MRQLPFGNKKDEGKFTSFERLIRHFAEISSQIENDKKAVVIMCYLYDAEIFKIPENPNLEIVNSVKKSCEKGLEIWQVNLQINEFGVSLNKYFKLNLF